MSEAPSLASFEAKPRGWPNPAGGGEVGAPAFTCGKSRENVVPATMAWLRSSTASELMSSSPLPPR